MMWTRPVDRFIWIYLHTAADTLIRAECRKGLYTGSYDPSMNVDLSVMIDIEARGATELFQHFQ